MSDLNIQLSDKKSNVDVVDDCEFEELLISIPLDCSHPYSVKIRTIRFEDEVMDRNQYATKNTSLNWTKFFS